jgi:ABC-type transporter Mla maintaining outer membrane lipid asymmetry permease subunit MlaE
MLTGAAATALSWTHLTIGSTRFVALSTEAFSPLLLMSCVIKGLLMAATVTVSAYAFGSRQIESAQAVGRSVNRAVVFGALSVLAVDLLVSWIMFAR